MDDIDLERTQGLQMAVRNISATPVFKMRNLFKRQRMKLHILPCRYIFRSAVS